MFHLVSTARCAILLAGASTALIAMPALAAPVIATATVSGSSGNYIYNFTFTNNVSPDQYLYLVGLRDATGTIAASPPPFSQLNGGFFTNATDYNLAWIVYGSATTSIAFGQSLGGFSIRDTAATLKTSFDFVGASSGSKFYTAGDNAYGLNTKNPTFLFSADVTEAAVPEPATWAMMMFGFGAMGFAMRRKQAVTRIRFA